MTDLVDVVRSSVQTWECDSMGHMNVQFYVEKAAEGLDSFAVLLGLGPYFARAHDTGFAAVDQHIRFHREVRPGAPFIVRAGVLDVRSHSLRIYEEMVNAATGTVIATFITDAAFVERATMKPYAIPAAAQEKAQALRAQLPQHGAPRGLTFSLPRQAPTLADADAMGMVATFQGVVKAHECDRFGFVQPRHYMGRVSDAIPVLLASARGQDRSTDPASGGAALEYRFVFRKAAQVGDVLAVRSGLKSVASKTYSWCHWLFDVETGDAVATAEAVAVAMDLVARKAIALPDEERLRMQAAIIPGLSV